MYPMYEVYKRMSQTGIDMTGQRKGVNHIFNTFPYVWEKVTNENQTKRSAYLHLLEN